MTEQKITPCLWFDFNAEEAVDHYLAIFPKSRVISTTRYGDFAPAGTTTEDHPKLPSYSQFNLQLGIKDKAYTLELYGRNITDEKGISSYNNMQGYNQTGLLTLIQPRTIGLRVAATY